MRLSGVPPRGGRKPTLNLFYWPLYHVYTAYCHCAYVIRSFIYIDKYLCIYTHNNNGPSSNESDPLQHKHIIMSWRDDRRFCVISFSYYHNIIYILHIHRNDFWTQGRTSIPYFYRPYNNWFKDYYIRNRSKDIYYGHIILYGTMAYALRHRLSLQRAPLLFFDCCWYNIHFIILSVYGEIMRLGQLPFYPPNKK